MTPDPEHKPLTRFFLLIRSLEWNGFAMLMLSNVVMLLSLGAFFLVLVRRVWRHASVEAHVDVEPDCMLILGRRLNLDGPSVKYQQRLDRAYRLAQRYPKLLMLVLGGRTSRHPLTEAQAGRQYLVRRGIDEERITAEDGSRHTLENLKNALHILADRNASRIILVTNRYHLHRASVLAHGLGMRLRAIPAEDKPAVSAAQIYAMLREAYFLHWYYVGKWYATKTGNKTMLRRIT